MYIAQLVKRSSVKVRIDGPDSKGKNTSRQIMVCDADVDEVVKVIREALVNATNMAAAALTSRSVLGCSICKSKSHGTQAHQTADAVSDRREQRATPATTAGEGE
jgi:hypothetical protein